MDIAMRPCDGAGTCTYPSIDGIQVEFSLLGPLLPEVWILQRNVCAVTSCNKASLQTEMFTDYRLCASITCDFIDDLEAELMKSCFVLHCQNACAVLSSYLSKS